MIQLIHGDCLTEMAKIPAGSVDMVLADPPYGTTQCKWDSIIPLEPMWTQLKRLIKPNGVIVLMAQTPFDKVLGVSNISMLKYEWIYEKTSATGHFNANKAPLKAHENALVFSEDENDHWNMLVFYKKLPIYTPKKTEGHLRKTSRKSLKNSECYGNNTRVTEYNSTSRYPRSVQRFASDKQKLSLHPTQKPVALMKYLIETYSNEGDTVLDFTMGSGTTGVACNETGRGFIGIELDEQYFNIAKQRINFEAQETAA